MKQLYLSNQQALSLAVDLAEYANLEDSNGRDLFKGFIIRYGDLLAEGVQEGETLEMHPIAECTLIEPDQ